MLNQSTIARTTREFFDLKNHLVGNIEDYEKKIYSEKEEIEQIQSTFNRLWNIVEKNNSEYFRLKLETLDNLLKRTIEKRAYKKIEFDRIFKTIDKIKQNDSVEFLNEALRNRIEKISEKIFLSKHKPEPVKEEQFYLLTYKTLHFLVKNYPSRILYEVDASKDFVKIKNERYPLFPAFTGIRKTDSNYDIEYCNVLILEVENKFKCVRFDSMETISDFTVSELTAKLLPLTTPMLDVKNYIKIRGNRVYHIDI